MSRFRGAGRTWQALRRRYVALTALTLVFALTPFSSYTATMTHATRTASAQHQATRQIPDLPCPGLSLPC